MSSKSYYIWTSKLVTSLFQLWPKKSSRFIKSLMYFSSKKKYRRHEWILKWKSISFSHDRPLQTSKPGSKNLNRQKACQKIDHACLMFPFSKKKPANEDKRQEETNEHNIDREQETNFAKRIPGNKQGFGYRKATNQTCFRWSPYFLHDNRITLRSWCQQIYVALSIPLIPSWIQDATRNCIPSFFGT